MNMEELVQQTLQTVFKDETIIFDKSRFAGGLTNYNYILEINGTDYVVREPGSMTDQMINRGMEKTNNAIASEFGVNSDCIYFDEQSGIKISVYIPNSKNIAQANPADLDNIYAVCQVLQKIHTSPKHFENVFEWDDELEKYEEIIRQLHGDFFFDYDELKSTLFSFMDTHIKPTPLVPCHNDTVPENFIIDGTGRAYLIDWEYSGMNDLCWDLAAYIVESRLPEEAITALVETYFSGPLHPDDELKIKCYMMAQDLLWAAWALIRHYSGDDFFDYCLMRYERLRRNVHALSASTDYSMAEMVR